MLLSLMLVAGLTSGLQAPTDEGGAITLRRLRSMDASMRATIDEGCRRSPTLPRSCESSNGPILSSTSQGAVAAQRDEGRPAARHRWTAVPAHPLERRPAAGSSSRGARARVTARAGGGAGRHQRPRGRDGNAIPADRWKAIVRRPAATVRNRGRAARGRCGCRRPSVAKNRRDAPSLGGCRADDVGPNPVVIGSTSKTLTASRWLASIGLVSSRPRSTGGQACPFGGRRPKRRSPTER